MAWRAHLLIAAPTVCTVRRWTCWNTIFLLQWIGSASILPLKGTRWGALTE